MKQSDNHTHKRKGDLILDYTEEIEYATIAQIEELEQVFGMDTLDLLDYTKEENGVN